MTANLYEQVLPDIDIFGHPIPLDPDARFRVGELDVIPPMAGVVAVTDIATEIVREVIPQETFDEKYQAVADPPPSVPPDALIVRSANGNAFAITVDDAGNIAATPVSAGAS